MKVVPLEPYLIYELVLGDHLRATNQRREELFSEKGLARQLHQEQEAHGPSWEEQGRDCRTRRPR